MNTLYKNILAISLIASLMCIASCKEQGSTATVTPDTNAFDTHESQEELSAYLEYVLSEKDKTNGDVSSVSPDAPSSEPSEVSPSISAPADQVETNNQENNVDEGDIVKFADGRLIILRDQHLLVLDISGDRKNNPVILSDTELDVEFGSGNFGKGAWYDEMLIFGSRILLIAYRFNAQIVGQDGREPEERTGAIELLQFDLLQDGKLNNLKRIYIESSDYYSGATNYATRKTGNSLIVYSPFYARSFVDSEKIEAKIPYVLELVDARRKYFRRVAPAIDYSNIYKGSFDSSGFVLHTIYLFNMDNGIGSFDASAVLGDYARTYYVTDKHLYLDLGIWKRAERDVLNETSSFYKFNIDPGNVKLDKITEIPGVVPERFAMSESSDNIRLISEGGCVYQNEARNYSCNLYAASLKISDLSQVASHTLPINSYGMSSIRFNGDYAVISPRQVYFDSDDELFVADFTQAENMIVKSGVKITNLQLMQPYAGNKFLAIEYQSSSYEFSDIKIHILEVDGSGLHQRSSYVMSDGDSLWSESFWNDHAFFFDPEKDIFAIPYGVWEGPDSRWEYGVQYFFMGNDNLTTLGDGITQTGDTCYECWYGNSRVVRSADAYYNLLGRQLKVSEYNPTDMKVVEVNTLELF